MTIKTILMQFYCLVKKYHAFHPKPKTECLEEKMNETSNFKFYCNTSRTTGRSFVAFCLRHALRQCRN